MSDTTQEAGDKVQAIKQQVDSDLLETAAEVDVDVDTIVERQVEENAKYGDSTIARFAQTAIRREVEAANAEEAKGIIMGSRDRHGKNWPRRHSLVKSDGEHMEVSTWDGSLPGGDGSEREIPTGAALVSMDVDFDEEYDSYEGRRLNGVKDYDLDELVDNLGKVAVDPSELTAADEYDTVVVRGNLTYVNAQTIFEDGETAGDGPILMEDERGALQPHFEAVIEGDDPSVRFRGHVERQAYGEPYFAVPDLLNLCHDAYERYESPGEQANFVGNGLSGVEVIAVGNINSFDRDRNEEGNPVTYVDMGVTAMVAIEDQTLGQFADDAGDDEAEAGGEDAENDLEEDDANDDGEESHVCEGCGAEFDTPQALNGHKSSCDEHPPGEDDDAVSDDDVAEMRENIEQYEGLTGETLETVEEVRENLTGVDADDAVIRAALTGSAQNDEGDADGDGEQSLAEVLAPLEEGGTFNCLDPECLVSEGSAAAILGHIADEHGIPDEYDDPEAWARAEFADS